MLAERHMAQEREAAAKLWPCIASATRRIPRAA
jgi:hypothetical protein